MGLLYPIQFTQLLKQGTLKAPPLVRVDVSWDTIVIKPLPDQYFSFSGGLLVPSGLLQNEKCTLVNIYAPNSAHVWQDSATFPIVRGSVADN